MSTTITYGNNQIGGNGQPVPFVSKSVAPIRYGSYWGQKNTITLHGQIVGCNSTTLFAAQQSIISKFAQDYQTLTITDDSPTSWINCIVRDINFTTSSYSLGTVDYTVTLENYDDSDGIFAYFGILEPVNSWSYEETADGLVNATHTVSAKGFETTSKSAFQNAKDFVLDRTGVDGAIVPAFITDGNENLCLKSIAENANRVNGTYSVTETYVSDKLLGSGGVLRYTVEYECGQDGVSKVTVAGSVDGCGMEADTSGIRTTYAGINTLSKAQAAYSAQSVGGQLNTTPISKSYSEDAFARKLNFSVTYDNIQGSVFSEVGTTVDIDENEITTITVEGTIKGRGNLSTRWAAVETAYTGINTLGLANSANTSGFPLNISPKAKSVTYNRIDGEISFSVSYDNKDKPLAGFEEMSYTLSCNPPLKKYIVAPLLNECGNSYYYAEAGYNKRGEFSFEGQGRIVCSNMADKNTGKNSARSAANQAFGASGMNKDPILEVRSLGEGPDTITFKFQWSGNGEAFDV